MNTSTPTRSTPLWRRAFILDTGKVYEGCKTRRTSQLADDCHLIAEEFLHFHALRGKEDFILHHRAIALDLRVSESPVRKAINRLSQAGVIVLTKRQSLGPLVSVEGRPRLRSPAGDQLASAGTS